MYCFPSSVPTSKLAGINACWPAPSADNKEFICANCAALYAANTALSALIGANTPASLTYKALTPAASKAGLKPFILSFAPFPTTPRLLSLANGASSRVYY